MSQFNLGGGQKAWRTCLALRSRQGQSDRKAAHRSFSRPPGAAGDGGAHTPLAQEQSQRRMLQPLCAVWPTPCVCETHQT